MGKRLKPPVCPHCSAVAVFFQNSAQFYRGSDLGPVWACVPCAAWVGCHKGTKRPLGLVANKELREAKIAAHDIFDRLWKGKMRRDRCTQGEARAAGYKWLADQLRIDPKDCHIGMMDAAGCARVIAACQPYAKR